VAPDYKSLPGRHYCPVLLPYFSFAGGRTAFGRLRRRIYARQQQRRPRLRRRIPIYFFLWPFNALTKACKATRVWGAAAQALGAPPPWRQVPRIWWLSVRYNLTPIAYYGFRLWRDETLARADSFLEEHEGVWICDEIMVGQDRMLIDDKARFADFCRQHQLPSIPLVVTILPDGKLSWPGAAHRLPPGDLFVKNRALWSGIGASIWTWDAERESYRCGEWCLDQEALLQHLCAQVRSTGTEHSDGRPSSREGLIVHARVSNHPSLADMSPDALSTLRCYTWRRDNEPAAVYRALWRVPRRGMITDHASRGGLLAAVADDGRLSRPQSWLLTHLADGHPDYAVPITGRRLPDHAATLALCRRAHDASGICGILAWDVALLESGPVLVEGGTSGGVETVQVAHDEALGDTEIVDALMDLLDAATVPARCQSG
jgi:hypothetical protein